MSTRDSIIQELLPIADLALPVEAQPPRARRIYCNRDLRLDQVEAIGFDMDYTLAMYRQEAMDRLSIEATAKKLVQRGYPDALLQMSFRANFPIRGLLVDTKLGNIVKTDRYRYAKDAYHGTRELSSEERKKAYAGKRIRPGMQRYYSLDTLYALSEVTVYAAVIDALDGADGRAPLDYAELFRHVRESIDEAHRDGTIKNIIGNELETYIERDPELPAMLHKLRSAGKKLFLLTNSEPAYTERVMHYLLDAGLPEYQSWRGYFDVVIAEAGKPRFFTEERAFEEVLETPIGAPAHKDGNGDGSNGHGNGHNGHAPTPYAYPSPDGIGSHGTRLVSELSRGRLYRLGCLSELERILGVPPDHILYVGDHIFGDVLRAKKDSAWRTLMIIQEMTDELDAIERNAPQIDRVHRLEARHYALLDSLRDRQSLVKSINKKLDDPETDLVDRTELEAARTRLKRGIERVRVQIKAVDDERSELERRLERAYHPFWGSPFKAESELSSFGEQVERYACIYTDRVTNLLGYSASHFFRGPRHRMAHEL